MHAKQGSEDEHQLKAGERQAPSPADPAWTPVSHASTVQLLWTLAALIALAAVVLAVLTRSTPVPHPGTLAIAASTLPAFAASRPLQPASVSLWLPAKT